MFFSATLDGAIGGSPRCTRGTRCVTRSARRDAFRGGGRPSVHPGGAAGQALTLARLASEASGSTLVFVNTKRAVDHLARQLRAEGVTVVAMHGDMTQQARERALSRFDDGHVGSWSRRTWPPGVSTSSGSHWW